MLEKLLGEDYQNNFVYKHWQKIVLLTALGLFMLLTLVGICTHEPWLDEAQAWLIAQDLNFFEILKHMKYEGHMFMWFLALMPTAKLHLDYPMPMLITNLIFIWAAVFIFLKDAKLHPLIKVPVIFSVPIAYQYGIIARPYAMGIMFLFLLAALYKDKLKRPYLYCTLVILCANTSGMALCGAAAFGILFLWDYLKDRKEFWKSKEFYILLSIALVGLSLLGYQLLGAEPKNPEVIAHYIYAKPSKMFWYMLYDGLCNMYFGESFLKYLLPILFLGLSVACFWKDKKALVFYAISNITLGIITLFFYSGYQWHHFFFYIYWIISIWLYNLNTEKSGNTILYKLLITYFVITSLFLDYISAQMFQGSIRDVLSNSKAMAQKIRYDKNVRNGNLVVCDEGVTSVVPYLRNYGIKAYSCFDGKEASFFNRKYNEILFMTSERFSPKYLEKFEDKDIYILVQNNQKAVLKSNYYKLNSGYCSEAALYDWIQYCVIKLEKGY